jgi:hypothetical protein
MALGVLDIWQRPVTDCGQTGPDKGQGGRSLIIPPSHEDLKMDGVFVVRSQTVQVWFATCGLSPDPKAAKEAGIKHKQYSLRDKANPPANKVVRVAGRPWASHHRSDRKYPSDLFLPEAVEPRDSVCSACCVRSGSFPGKPSSQMPATVESSLKSPAPANSWLAPSPTKNA